MCGGVEGSYNIYAGHAPELDEQTCFIGRWMGILRPGYAALPPGDDASRKRALEKASVVISLDNLMTFPFVCCAVETGDVTLHGLWNDIGAGGLEVYDPASTAFVAI